LCVQAMRSTRGSCRTAGNSSHVRWGFCIAAKLAAQTRTTAADTTKRQPCCWAQWHHGLQQPLLGWSFHQPVATNYVRTLAILSATLYFCPSFSNSAMTQSVMQGVHSAYRQSNMPFTRSICSSTEQQQEQHQFQPPSTSCLQDADHQVKRHAEVAGALQCCRMVVACAA
jgi:hypothetical protein